MSCSGQSKRRLQKEKAHPVTSSRPQHATGIQISSKLTLLGRLLNDECLAFIDSLRLKFLDRGIADAQLISMRLDCNNT
ncbi:MAG: hypothetical protein ACN4GG_01805 [Akkermansiaceae bacterium]